MDGWSVTVALSVSGKPACTCTVMCARTVMCACTVTCAHMVTCAHATHTWFLACLSDITREALRQSNCRSPVRPVPAFCGKVQGTAAGRSRKQGPLPGTKGHPQSLFKAHGTWGSHLSTQSLR